MYDSGYSSSYQEWIGKYANSRFDYFARHDSGKSTEYSFNTAGYRGSEHHDQPDITVFGSSFSFGVGIEFHQCWHQLLGDYRVNCMATAGFMAVNDDIINHYQSQSSQFGKTIIQLREYRYNRGKIEIPNDVMIFAIDENVVPNMLTLTWGSFVDRAEDGVHPGINTHKLWAQIIKHKFNL